MMDQERAIFKAKEQFEQVLDLIQDAVDEGKVIDEVERDLWQNRLRIGQTLLQGYVDSHGSGDLGPTLEHEGHSLAGWSGITNGGMYRCLGNCKFAEPSMAPGRSKRMR